jgi:uncharacterized protein involved in exopolysaccharide biosynthesis
MDQEENVKTLAEYFDILKRRKHILLISFFSISFLGFVLAMKLPPVYRSVATILIEDQQIPRTMVETTITDFADKRIQLIKQRVMTRDRILSIIQKHKLYLDKREKLVPSELVKLFQEDAAIALIAADVADPQRGAGKATIAFTISFSDKHPGLAQAVANELVSLFLEENTRVRAQRAAKTTEFLNEEADKLKRDIERVESKLAEYKGKYGQSLPDAVPMKLSAIERDHEALRQTENDIRTARDRIAYLSDALVQAREQPTADPARADRPLSKDEQIRSLKSQYIHLSSRYNPNHPDVLRIKRQIQTLDPGFTGDASASDTRAELLRAEAELDLLKEKYSENHPDVVKQRQRVEMLTQKTSEASDQAGELELSEDLKGNALYLSLSSQLRSTQHELDYALKRREELQKTLHELQSHVDRAPAVEKEYGELLRDRQTILNKYAELEAKSREARLAQTLEEEQKGETFALIEPPVAPDKPEKPDRKKIMAFAMGLGLASGLGIAMLLEMMHEVIRGPKALERITGTAPVVVIPYIETPLALQARKRRLRWIGLALTTTCIVLLVATHFLVMPLEMIWANIMHKVTRL